MIMIKGYLNQMEPVWQVLILDMNWNEDYPNQNNNGLLVVVNDLENHLRDADFNALQVPHEFICPITQHVMVRPVLCLGMCNLLPYIKLLINKSYFHFVPLKCFYFYEILLLGICIKRSSLVDSSVWM